jgi:hypothetical protein
MSVEPQNPDVRSEEDVLPARTILAVLATVIALSLICVGIAFGIMRSLEWSIRPSGSFPERDLPAPGDESLAIEQVMFKEEIVPGERKRAAQQKALTSYGWADQSRRLVHIPIEDSMQLYLKGQGR